MEMFEAGEFDVATVIFNRFKSAMTQIVTAPAAHPAAAAGAADAAPADDGRRDLRVRAGRGEILADLLPRNLTVQIFRALLENAASFTARR